MFILAYGTNTKNTTRLHPSPLHVFLQEQLQEQGGGEQEVGVGQAEEAEQGQGGGAAGGEQEVGVGQAEEAEQGQGGGARRRALASWTGRLKKKRGFLDTFKIIGGPGTYHKDCSLLRHHHPCRPRLPLPLLRHHRPRHPLPLPPLLRHH